MRGGNAGGAGASTGGVSGSAAGGGAGSSGTSTGGLGGTQGGARNAGASGVPVEGGRDDGASGSDASGAPGGGAGAGDGGLDHAVPGACSIVTDDGLDGTADYVRTLDYDAKGRLVVSAADWDGDGALDSKTTVEYDDTAHTKRTRSDTGADGTVEFSEVDTYDDEWRLIDEQTDSNNDGALDFHRVTTYDADGNIVHIESLSSAGSYDVVDYAYDAGQLVRIDVDEDGDGTTDYSTGITYDERGNDIEEVVTGSRTSTWTKAYDAQDRLVSEEYSVSVSLQWRRTYTYDDDGRLVRTEQDDAVDGLAIDTTAFEYDLAGNVVRTTQDSNGDGALDKVEEVTYDAGGNRLTATEDDGKPPAPDSRSTYGYACFR